MLCDFMCVILLTPASSASALYSMDEEPLYTLNDFDFGLRRPNRFKIETQTW